MIHVRIVPKTRVLVPLSELPCARAFSISSIHNTHGATVSVPILGDDDQLQGVFGLDIELKVVSAFL